VFAIRSTNQARKETRHLQIDVAEANKREQADRVCTWIHDDYHKGVVALLNSSAQPVYNVVVHWVYIQGAAWSTGEQAEKLLANDLGRGINTIRPVLQVVPPENFNSAAAWGTKTSCRADLGWSLHSPTWQVTIGFAVRGGIWNSWRCRPLSTTASVQPCRSSTHWFPGSRQNFRD
jgi:hypothetical protein